MDDILLERIQRSSVFKVGIRYFSRAIIKYNRSILPEYYTESVVARKYHAVVFQKSDKLERKRKIL